MNYTLICYEKDKKITVHTSIEINIFLNPGRGAEYRLNLFIYHVMHLINFDCFAKTPWSWGRMDDILSEGSKIESRRQLRK